MKDTELTITVSQVGDTYTASLTEIRGDDELMGLPLEGVGYGSTPTQAVQELVARWEEAE